MATSTSSLIQGDCRLVLPWLVAGSVHCCVTSPPYFGLRDYQLPPSTWEDGWIGCLGLEPTPEMYVAHVVECMRVVWRVLRDDGTLWLNIGDSYCSTDKWGGGKSGNTGKHTTNGEDVPSWAVRARSPVIPGVKPKDLIGVPWVIAFALRADGWYLRSEIIWHKPNAMPGSQKDRPTRDFEHVFMLSKQSRYYYDHEAVKEEAVGKNAHDLTGPARKGVPGQTDHTGSRGKGSKEPVSKMRSRRSVWSINTVAYADAHFAVFPPELAEVCVLAGCPPDGTVLDPFAGSGTTGLVAVQHGRSFIGVELGEQFVEMAHRRIDGR